jgi:hypothetical protein
VTVLTLVLYITKWYLAHTDDSHERIIHESFKQNNPTCDMKDDNNTLKQSWEDVRGLSWIFDED